MNALTRDLKHMTDMVEQTADPGSRFRQKLHLMPPVGWLNDPNGLCQFQGIYHAFFQYSPFDVNGGVKMWGHAVSKDMIRWEYKDTALYPDQPFDCHGVYSGCALIDEGKMYLYYTGNVKLEDKEYDYILEGREGNTILTESRDGLNFGPKKLLMRNGDYPSDLSCHVRDPKVWKEKGHYYMVQGVRTKDNAGQVQIFESDDRINWKPKKRISTSSPFGYMWECPDYFTVDGQNILSASVQGLTGGIWEERNVYQSGYFFVEGDIMTDSYLSEYQLWDYGFDFYAPQSFQAEDGRIILLAWMGMPDCEEYGNISTIREGWQHCFTFPRELYKKDGKICQRPVRELEQWKKAEREERDYLSAEGAKVYDIRVSGIKANRFRAVLGEELLLEYKEGYFRMEFENRDKEGTSGGRGVRRSEVAVLRQVEILADVSSVEVFINDGELVFSTRYYPRHYSMEICCKGASIIETVF